MVTEECHFYSFNVLQFSRSPPLLWRNILLLSSRLNIMPSKRRISSRWLTEPAFLLAGFLLVTVFITKMEAMNSTETFVDFGRKPQCYNPQVVLFVKQFSILVTY
jgi:hypothetical protein